MKKITFLTSALAFIISLFIGCASTDGKVGKKIETEAESVQAESFELAYGSDYFIEEVFGQEFFVLDGQTFYFMKGSLNNNHAAMFYLLDTSKFYEDYDIVIEYELGVYRSDMSCQLCIQPCDMDNVDWGCQKYPILYNNFEPDAEKVLRISINDLKKSKVKDTLIGFRIVSNGGGSYEKFNWQDDWDFTITKITLEPSK